MLGKLTAFVKLTRIEHSLMLIIAVLAGEIISKGMPDALALCLSLISPVLISMGAFAINDYFDVEVDRKNGKVGRPLVSGELSRSFALYSSLLLLAMGIAAAAGINIAALVVALVFAVLAFLYSYKMKEMLLLGNVYVAFSMAIPFIFGNYVVSNALNMNVIVISAIITLSGLGREIQGTIRDYEGDRKARNVRSLPYYLGIRNSAITALMLYFAAIALSICIAFIKGPYYLNGFYLYSILFVDVILSYIGVKYLAMGRENRTEAFRKLRNLSLADMALALFIYLIACFVSFPVI